jgi:transmembrane sensor
MNKIKAEELLEKYHNGEASAEEQRLIQNWFLKQDGAELLDAEQLLQDHFIIKDALVKHMEPARRRKLWPRVAVAAAAVAAIVFGVWFFNAQYRNGRHPELVSGSQYANDVKPGKNTATLTLANGQTINLSDAKTGVVVDASSLKYNDGTDVTSSLRGGTTKQPHTSDEVAASRNAPRNDDMMLTATTPKGGQYQITLPDGTRVWLNADSKISFPSQFIGEKRKILLEGEAYFEVAKVTRSSLRGGTTRQSFIVESKGQEVEVLGTHFNISAYSDEASVKTTLLEGSVRVSSLRAPDPSLRGGTTRQPHTSDEVAASRRAPRNDDRNNDERGDDSGNTVTLKPNQQAVLTANTNQIKIKQVDTEQAIAWQKGYFLFEIGDVPSIMRQLARWYNIDVVYQGDISNKTIGGSVSKYSNVSEVLNMLAETKTVKFKLSGRTVTVMPYE